jgi:Cu-Zn family superoxide dismutase
MEMEPQMSPASRASTLIAALPALLALGACASVPEVPAARIGSAVLQGANGLPAGTAQIVGSGDTVALSVALAGLPEGVLAMHLHTTGSCVAPDFTSAGGHLNPEGRQHGMLNPMGSHLGDLPNVTITVSGIGTATITLKGTRATLEPILFDADGTAVVIHASPDDSMTDPTGNAGARIACGEFKPA